VDKNESKVKTLCDGGVPIFERHLPELLARHGGRGVTFTTDLAAAVEQSEVIFIAVGTPQGDTGAADLSHVEAVVAQIARSINGYKVIVEKSTVPVHTSERIRRVMHLHGVAAESYDVVSNPEFLREGTAIVQFFHPDRIIVGANSERSAGLMRRIYEPLILPQAAITSCQIHYRELAPCNARPGCWSLRRRARRLSSTPPTPSWR
jgi:UDPglucose 6-dehydrogenase